MTELYERFARLRRDHPQRPLFYRPATGDAVTADQLATLADVIARISEAAGAAPDRPLAAVAGNTVTAVAVLLACRRLGVPVLPVDKGANPTEIAAIVERFGARLVIAGEGTFAHGAELAQRSEGSPARPRFRVATPLTDGLKLLIRTDEQGPAPPLTDVAVMKLTSGSTGLPKATLTTDANLVADGVAIIEAMRIRPDDVQLAAIPISHAYGLGNLVIPMLLQGTCIVLRDGFVPHQLASDCRRYEVTMMPGVPYMFEHLLEHLQADAWPERLTRLISAGARLEGMTAARFHHKFRHKIHSFYGTSETGGICYDDSADVDDDPTVGPPMPNVSITLAPEEGAPADGGRVHVTGPAVARGYAVASAADGSVDDPFVRGGFLTGDLGRFGRGHRLELHGRVSSFVNIAGRKVQPLEVETVLKGAPGVVDVRVLGAPDPLRGQQLVGCVVVDTSAVTAASLRAYCASRLAPYKIPRQFVFLDVMPLTDRGKTDRARLEALIAPQITASR